MPDEAGSRELRARELPEINRDGDGIGCEK
jgi:hypothetical protein